MVSLTVSELGKLRNLLHGNGVNYWLKTLIASRLSYARLFISKENAS